LHNLLINPKSAFVTFRACSNMKVFMNIVSLALLVMTRVTADEKVRAYHPSLFVGYMYAVPQLLFHGMEKK
jgi:hypothetical protein